MDLEKYKKFLDGLGTLKGIYGRRGGEAEPAPLSPPPSAPAALSHLPSMEANRGPPPAPQRSTEELLASQGGSRQGGAFQGSASLPSFVCALDSERGPGTKRAPGQERASPESRAGGQGQLLCEEQPGKALSSKPSPRDWSWLPLPRAGG